MIDIEKLKAFAEPYYAGKDIMHDMWHIELTGRWVDRILEMGGYEADREALTCALYFHGFIWSDEQAIRDWLNENGADDPERIIRIAWESQRPEVPETLEGKILHDAHVLEGGRTYLVVKTLITGSVRGQSLRQTLDDMNAHVLGRNRCYLPETAGLCGEMDRFARDFVEELEKGIL